MDFFSEEKKGTVFQCFVTATAALLLCVRVKGKADALCNARKIDLQMNWVVCVRSASKLHTKFVSACD